MIKENQLYDCAIIGGGLAGLCLSIQLAKQNRKVILLEKNQYPFHKVCGEYISNESWDFIQSLGLNLEILNLPSINKLSITSAKGFQLKSDLELGGFGISRFALDNELFIIAKKCGVRILENCKVNNVINCDHESEIETTLGIFKSVIVCGSYGRNNPSFINKKVPLKQIYIGVKYHIKINFPLNKIELHNFKNGYCGISAVDNNIKCLCYLTTAKNLQICKNDIKLMEERILKQNPFLKEIFNQAEFVYEKPLVISNVTFSKKNTFINGIFLLGDASGTIAPLCGNGMSMGMRASKLLAEQLNLYFDKLISKEKLILNYENIWNKNFFTRIKVGNFLQTLFGNNTLTHVVLKLLSKTPLLLKKIISYTHGKPF